MKKCYLVGAGDVTHIPSPDDTDLVIAADGGYDHLIAHGVRCDLLIGDLDSITSVPEGVETVRFPVKKDDTDMHLAYKEGVKRGFSAFEIYGGTGGRIDHTLANISLLLSIAKNGHAAFMDAPEYTARVVLSSSVTLSCRAGVTFSVFAIGGDAEGVTIEGALYPAKNVTLTPDYPLGVSNSFVGTDVTVSVKRGALLIISEK